MTLYELFFDMEVNLSDRFPALTPIIIRKTKASEVFLLVRRLGDKNKREKKNKTLEGKQKIRRPAGDNWF